MLLWAGKFDISLGFFLFFFLSLLNVAHSYHSFIYLFIKNDYSN